MKTEVPHLLVVIPGIGGSVLQKGDEDLWNLSPSVALKALLSRGRSIEELVPDDPAQLDDPDFADGVRATRLIDSPISLPGLARIGGYDSLRRALHESYELNELNYLEFAYDWRRDVRISAARLQHAIDARLEELDAYVGRADVIVIAHSMGGLVARSWLAELGGAERCRGLITLGTPYRGSPKTIRMLAGGFVWKSIGSERFAEILRALPTVHQLLPIYPCVHDIITGDLVRVGDVDLPGVDPARARRASELLTALNSTEQPAMTSVIGGTGQPTLQSVTSGPDGLSYPNTPLPENFGRSSDSDGDATVPWIASRPLDYGDVRGLTPTFANQSHGGLSRESGILDALMARLAHLLVEDDPARAPFEVPPPAPAPPSRGVVERPRLGFDLDEDYLEGEPIEVRVTTGGMPEGTAIALTIDELPAGQFVVGDRPLISVTPLSAGPHHVRLQPATPVGGADLTVLDTIDVWPA